MKVAVIGAGSFGTALAKVLAENQHQVNLWSHSQDTIESIKENQENSIYLEGIKIPKNIYPMHDIEKSLHQAELVLSVVPTQVTRQVWQNAKKYVPKNANIVSASKGIEKGSNKLVSDVMVDEFGEDAKKNLFFLSGPSFARELAECQPTLATIAGYQMENIKKIQTAFHNQYFRVYGTDDVIGVELGGALKNVMALATGIVDGVKYGNNSRAAIITRGLAEIARLGKEMGANPLTFMGLAGIGDLVLTCTGGLSRNRSVGVRLGEGEKLDDIIGSMRMVAEGVPTTQGAYALSKSFNVDMPITEAVYQILYENVTPQESLQRLMSRRMKFEHESE